VTLGAYAHQDLPFEKLVEQMQPERDKSHSPLFQVMLAFEGATPWPHDLGELKINVSGIDNESTTYDLTFILEDAGEGITGIVKYNSDLFEPATVGRLVKHFETLLQGVIANPGQNISELPLMTETERRKLLVECNSAQATFPVEMCLHEIFERQVDRTPDAVAATFEGQPVSYAELNAPANQLAHHLHSLGVQPDDLIGIYLEPSIEMVVAILGILKSGGAYLPLDPEYPKARIEFILKDAKAKAVVTTQRRADDLQEQVACMICLDSDGGAIAQNSSQNISSKTDPGNLAYVIYTSGSTGEPKGVNITHANVARLFDATRSWFNFDESDVWTMFHSYAFDFSVWELWGALLHGGRLIVIPDWLRLAPESFYDLLAKERVTVLNQTPSSFRQLIKVEHSSRIERELSLRLVIFGGEALEPQILKPWFDRHGERPRLINMYGITETTVHVTYRPILQVDANRISDSVIGGPIPDLQVYVLDRHMQPAPMGVPGELYVGGAGLARSYLDRPALTAERFVPDPFSNNPGSRLYRSGDLARHLPEGDIQYSGRIDHQVKIRGFRIELGEIEAMLAQHDAVREAVVIDREDRPGDKRLVAYVVPGDRQVPTIGELRDFLGEKLPEYMLPSAFVVLESLPLTRNLKLDRCALPAPEQARPELAGYFVAPRTPLEETLAEIWCEVLGIDKVGVYDNFFDLGGHSLLMTQLASRIRDTFQLELPLRILFDAPTIIEMTTAIATQRIEEEEDTGEIEAMLKELKQLSPEEVKQLLEAQET
jgi:amino acid adenylation domain-containing protein